MFMSLFCEGWAFGVWFQHVEELEIDEGRDE